MNTKYHQAEGFKFNPAGLIGLDDSIAKGIAKHLRARERELNTIETVYIMCIEGPFDGQSIELQPTGESGAHRSAEFTVGAWRGYYLGSKWVSTLEADAAAPVATVTHTPRPRIACDLPAKGFDQLRELLGELSENPADHQAVARKYTNEQINKAREGEPDYRTRRRSSECYLVNYTEGVNLVTYKIGRCSYTIVATIEACERLGKSLLKNKKWFSDKMLAASGPARAAVATQPTAQVAPVATTPTAPAVQPVAIVIDTPPALLPKIEQPAKPLATTCNPDAARLRAKATMCRAANRQTWADKLEAQADALERVDPTEPPPCKPKNKSQRQRPRKTVCILLAKIHHPVRQNFRDHLAERLVSKIHEPPGIKTDTPPAHFHQPEPRLNPCHAHNLNPATHQPPRSKSKQSAVICPCQPLPNFAVSMWQAGKHGKLDVTACPPPFGGYSTSYWITPSCRTKIKASDPRQTFASVSTQNLAFSLLNFSPPRRENLSRPSDVMA